MSDFEWRDRRLRRALRRIPQDLHVELKKGFQNISRRFMREFAREYMSTGYRARSSPTRGVFVRSGQLRRALGAEVTGANIDQLTATVGWTDQVAARRAWLFERGGTITSNRPGGFLTIPLDAALNPSGIATTTAREVISQGGFIAKGIVFRKNAGGSITPMFALKQSVRIRARLGFYEAWQAAKARDYREEEVSRSVDRALARARLRRRA